MVNYNRKYYNIDINHILLEEIPMILALDTETYIEIEGLK